MHLKPCLDLRNSLHSFGKLPQTSRQSRDLDFFKTPVLRNDISTKEVLRVLIKYHFAMDNCIGSLLYNAEKNLLTVGHFQFLFHTTLQECPRNDSALGCEMKCFSAVELRPTLVIMSV